MKTKTQNLGKVSITVEKDYHSTTEKYDKLTIVEEQGTFKTYISRKPVPVGTLLTNRNYWIPFSGVLESISMDYNSFKAEFIEAENGRVTAEGLRVLAEATRVENEDARILAEATRSSAEGTPSDAPSSSGTRWGKYNYAENSRNTSYSTAEGNSSSTSNDGSRWGAYKKAESDRNSAAETVEGTLSSTADDGSRWGAYKTAENARNTARETIEGSNASVAGDGTRWGAYKTAEDNRDTAYLAAEEARNTARETAEGNSNSEAGSSTRWGAYKTAEAARNTARETAEGTALSSAGDGTRWGAYKTAEAARDTARTTAEGTSSSTAGDGTRWGSYKAAEHARNSSYSDEEGSSTDIASETGSRWARFNSNEAERDAIVDAEVASITGIKTAIMYAECSTSGSTATKVITLDGYTLLVGGSMKIKFTNKNTANYAELRVDGTSTTGTAKPLYYNNVIASSTNTWEDGETVEVYYDGTNYYANNVIGGGGKFKNGEIVKDIDINKYAEKDGDYSKDGLISAEAENLVGESIDITDTYTTKITALDVTGEPIEVADGKCKINVIEGRGVSWNQLSPNNNPTGISNNVTLTNNGDGSITANGIAGPSDVWRNVNTRSIPVVPGHKYYLKGCPSGGSSSTYMVWEYEGRINYDSGSGSITTMGNISSIAIITVIRKGVNCDNIVFRPQFIDLTILNPTLAAKSNLTVAEVEAYLATLRTPQPYYAQNNGTLLGAKMLGWKLPKTPNLLNPTTGKAELPNYSYNEGNVNNSNTYEITGLDNLTDPTITFTPYKTGVALTVAESDGDITITDDYFTIPEAGVLQVTGTGDKRLVCVKNVWDGSKKGEHYTFKLSDNIFDSSKVYHKSGDVYTQVFQDGIMRATGDGTDAIRDKIYTYLGSDGNVKCGVEKNIGDYNLGGDNMTWEWTNKGEHVFISSSITDRAVGRNMICAKYTNKETAGAFNIANLTILGSNSDNTIYLRNDLYNNNNSEGIAALKGSLSDIHLWYKLATPVTYTSDLYYKTSNDEYIPLEEVYPIIASCCNWATETNIEEDLDNTDQPTSIVPRITEEFQTDYKELLNTISDTYITKDAVKGSFENLITVINSVLGTTMGGTISVSNEFDSNNNIQFNFNETL